MSFVCVELWLAVLPPQLFATFSFFRSAQMFFHVYLPICYDVFTGAIFISSYH